MTSKSLAAPSCPLCRTWSVSYFLSTDNKNYWRCAICSIRFLDPAQRPPPSDELAQYRLHENCVNDPGYRKFLAKLFDPLVPKLVPGASGLDYGCGPGPALAAMFREAGFSMTVYDPFFENDEAALDARYDFVVCTEVIEHFHQPAEEFDRLDALLKPHGWLGLMTCFQTDDGAFANWHYRKDPTHVTFYREETMHYIAETRGWTCEIPAKDVAIMHKPVNARAPAT